jgi:hypothetical protein
MSRLLCLLFCLSAILCLCLSTNAADTLYVRTSSVNLRDQIEGTKIGELLNRTAVTVIQEDGDWVQVSLTGWVNRSMLTQEKTQPLGSEKKKKIIKGWNVDNISFKNDGISGTECIGEVFNNTGNDYQTAMFTLSLYDANGRLLETSPFVINSFPNGQTKSFSCPFLSTARNLIDHYKFQFDGGM